MEPSDIAMDAIKVASTYVGLGYGNSIYARVLLSDSMKFQKDGDYEQAYWSALFAIRESIGRGHADYKRVAINIHTEWKKPDT